MEVTEAQKCLILFELLQYAACFTYFIVQLYVADNVTKERDMWDLQLLIDKDRLNLATCLTKPAGEECLTAGEPTGEVCMAVGEGCMAAGDYELFNYYWLFRLETVIIWSSMLTVLIFVIFKFALKKFLPSQSFYIATPSQMVSEDLLTRHHFNIRYAQQCFIKIFLGLLLFLDPSRHRVFRG